MNTLSSHVELVETGGPTVSLELLGQLLAGRHGNPHALLGAHEVDFHGRRAVAVRTYSPSARGVHVRLGGTQQTLPAREFTPGYFECVFFCHEPLPIQYVLHLDDHAGHAWETEDPYAFFPTVDLQELNRFNAGTHGEIYRVLGAHVRVIDGVVGTSFAVWAPNAQTVSVVGDFNQWDGRRHPMRSMGASGVWELFIPRLSDGTLYKYEVRTRNGALLTKTDPYGFRFEKRPQNASIVCTLDGYSWGDHAWLTRRAATRWIDEAMNIYEVHLGSWLQDPTRKAGFMNYREIAPKLAAYMIDMGYTHVELLPVMEHPYDGSWGYQVTGYYGVTSRFGSPSDFMFFVDHLHQSGLGVLVDWVPAHFPRDIWALGRFDGSALYEHEDPRQGEHRDWGTYIFNFGRPEVKNFLVANALFWMDYYHIDGLRVDAVASMLYLDYSRNPGDWLPNRYGGRENLEALEFLKEMNNTVHERHPGVITVAEESTSWPFVTRPTYVGGLGFDFKWNMGWMNDFLEYMKLDPVHRKYHHGKLTFAMMYAYSENFMLVLSHDEVVHGKASLQARMPGDEWRRFANLRAALGYMYAFPGKKLLFMGGEFGQYQEWWEAESIHWHLLQYDYHRQLHRYVRDLNHLYLREPSLHEVDNSWEGFQWIDCNDADHSVLSWVRRARSRDDYLVCAYNLTPMVWPDYRIGVPRDGWYSEILNSDSAIYGGSNVGNGGGLRADDVPSHGHPYSLAITLPPLSGIVFKPHPETWSPLRLPLHNDEETADTAGEPSVEAQTAATTTPPAFPNGIATSVASTSAGSNRGKSRSRVARQKSATPRKTL